jgi:Uma2 family endonuclease
MLIASNFGLVATVNQKVIVKAPDWLWVPRVQPVGAGIVRRSYTPRLEGDPVAIVMEFLSDTETGEYSSRPTHPYDKLFFYEQILQAQTYAIFDPAAVLLEVRRLKDGQYRLQTPNDAGRYWITELNLWLGIWQGERLGISTHWLRWWDELDNLLLWSAEKVEQERQRAEEESQRAEEERQRAEVERQRAEQERQARLEAVPRLLEMGLAIEQVAEALGLTIGEVGELTRGI